MEPWMSEAIIAMLKFAGIVFLFKGVLGYHFDENKIKAVAGVLVVVFAYCLEQWIIANEGLIFFWQEIFIPAAGISLLFAGRKAVSFLVAACMMCVYKVPYSLMSGAAILRCPAGVHNFSVIESLSTFICLIIMVAVAILFRKRKARIRKAMGELPPLTLLPFLLVSYVSSKKPVIFGDRTGYDQEFIYGENLVRSGITELVLVIAFVLVCILVSQRRMLKQTILLNEKCIREQTEQYRLLNRRERELRKFRHDYNAHIIALHRMAEKGEAEKAKKYIKTLSVINESTRLIDTNNIICDAILNQYAGLCKDDGVYMEIKGKISAGFPVEETDLCVIISNGVKNAYEAALKCKNTETVPHISVEIANQGAYTIITIVNSAPEAPVIRDGVLLTSKKDKQNHGIGTRNMVETIKKYGGSVSWEYDDNLKTVTTNMLFQIE